MSAEVRSLEIKTIDGDVRIDHRVKTEQLAIVQIDGNARLRDTLGILRAQLHGDRFTLSGHGQREGSASRERERSCRGAVVSTEVGRLEIQLIDDNIAVDDGVQAEQIAVA